MKKAKKKSNGAPATQTIEPFLVPSAAAWERWLEKNHAKSPGVWLTIAKNGSGLRTPTYDEALDGALVRFLEPRGRAGRPRPRARGGAEGRRLLRHPGLRQPVRRALAGDDGEEGRDAGSPHREGGNTEILARRAAEVLPAEAEVRWLRLADLPLEPFVDLRHCGGEYPAPAGHGATLLEATLWATDLVVAAPTYWYSLPAAAKLYLDHWSWWLRLPDTDFKARMAGKLLWGITVNSDGPGEDGGSAPLLATLELAAGYMKMRFGGALVGHGSRPGDVERDTAAMAAARAFFG